MNFVTIAGISYGVLYVGYKAWWYFLMRYREKLLKEYAEEQRKKILFK